MNWKSNSIRFIVISDNKANLILTSLVSHEISDLSKFPLEKLSDLTTKFQPH